jgi:hypothetical protein
MMYLRTKVKHKTHQGLHFEPLTKLIGQSYSSSDDSFSGFIRPSMEGFSPEVLEQGDSTGKA